MIVSQVGIAGSTKVGDGAVLAGQVGLVGHIEIGAGAKIGAQSGVSSDVPAGAAYFGSPARESREAMRILAIEAKLPEWVRRLRALEALAAKIQAI